MASFRKRGKVWYYRFTDENGLKCSRKGCTDKRATEQLARDAETLIARRKAGLSDAKAERLAREARRPIREHIAEFIAGMESKARDPKHVRSTKTYIERIITLGGIERIVGLTPSAVEQTIPSLKADGLSARGERPYNCRQVAFPMVRAGRPEC